MKNYLIIYHHKTGCVLSKKLIIIYQLILKEKISTIMNCFNNKINFDYLNNIIKIKYTEKYLLKSKYNIYYQSSPLYSFNLFNVFKKIDKLSFKFKFEFKIPEIFFKYQPATWVIFIC